MAKAKSKSKAKTAKATVAPKKVKKLEAVPIAPPAPKKVEKPAHVHDTVTVLKDVGDCSQDQLGAIKQCEMCGVIAGGVL